MVFQQSRKRRYRKRRRHGGQTRKIRGGQYLSNTPYSLTYSMPHFNASMPCQDNYNHYLKS